MNGHTTSFTYDDNVVSFEREGTRNYYQLDELGSTVYLTGTDGAAYSPKAYDPFGNILDPTTGKRRRTPGFKQNQGYTREGNIIQPFAFTGYREDETGLYYAQVRSYEPQAGRFTGEDRIRGLLQKPDSINHYCYCYGNPLDYVDQNGQFAVALPAVYAFIEAAAIVVGEMITTVASAAAAPYMEDIAQCHIDCANNVCQV
ncbi:MAG: RHS repeat-associated core domain-containing protein [Butyrivibrio sp.]|nr:RHS repeat-associated core domain-containing protein [Butyrivibrio sp.]